MRPPALWPRHALLLAALWAAALAAYSNSFDAGLVFDSQRVILADTRLQAATAENLGLIWNQDYYAGTGSGALYRPLTTLSYLWNYATLGDGPHAAGYHWTNFALHAVNIALLYFLGLLIFGDPWPAFALAALWALHPVLTESVTNVVGRADLLAACGLLAGLLCYARATTAAGGRRAAWLLALAAASTLAAFSKESGVVLPALLLAHDAALAPKTAWRARVSGYLAALLPVALFLVQRARVLARVSSLVVSFGDNPLLQTGFWTARMTAVKVLGKYLWLLLWPGTLAPDYSYNQVPLFGWHLTNREDLKALAALFIWIALAAAALFLHRRARPAAFFLLLFLIGLAPASNIFLPSGSIMAERFLYLPSIGFAGCLVWAAHAHWPASRDSLKWLLALLCLAMAARTYARNADWHDERALWTSAIEAAPASYKSHHNLAVVALAQTPPDFTTALRETRRSLAILAPLPDQLCPPSLYATAGLCYRNSGDLPGALALLLRGRNGDRAWNQAVTARNQADGKPASPVGTPALYLELGRVYLALGQPDNAMEALRTGLELDPQSDFFAAISQAYVDLRQPEQAVISLFEGLSVDPNQPALVARAVQLYRDTAPQSCALNGSGAGASLNGSCPLVHTHLCTATRHVVDLFTRLHDTTSVAAARDRAVQSWGCPAELFQ